MDEVTGIPYSTNANGVMYNTEIFKELGLSVPKTWDELLATAQKAKDAGIIPFYFTYKDDWQTVRRLTHWHPIWKALNFIWIGGKAR